VRWKPAQDRADDDASSEPLKAPPCAKAQAGEMAQRLGAGLGDGGKPIPAAPRQTAASHDARASAVTINAASER
jgi:hypothetical protein